MANNSLFKNTVLENKAILEIDGQNKLVQIATKEDISRGECSGEHYIYIDPKTGRETIYHIPDEYTRFCKVAGTITLPVGVKTQSISKFLTSDDIDALIDGTYSDENLDELNARLEEEPRKKYEKGNL